MYALGAEGDLRCLRAGNGELLWKTNILADAGARAAAELSTVVDEDAAGDDEVDMGVMGELLSPGVKNADEPHLPAQALSPESKKGLRCRSKERVVEAGGFGFGDEFVHCGNVDGLLPGSNVHPTSLTTQVATVDNRHVQKRREELPLLHP